MTIDNETEHAEDPLPGDTFKRLKHMAKYIKEPAHTNFGPRK